MGQKKIISVGVVVMIVLVTIGAYILIQDQSFISRQTPSANNTDVPSTAVTGVPALSTQMVAVDGIKNKIDDLIKNGTLRESKKEFGYTVPYEPTLKAIFVDQTGKVRKYVQEAGSDDSALQSHYYYDESLRLRFVFITGGAVNGSELEHTVYYNENGERISESHRYTKGPGYTFPEKWPENEIVLDPIKEFNK